MLEKLFPILIPLSLLSRGGNHCSLSSTSESTKSRFQYDEQIIALVVASRSAAVNTPRVSAVTAHINILSTNCSKILVRNRWVCVQPLPSSGRFSALDEMFLLRRTNAWSHAVMIRSEWWMEALQRQLCSTHTHTLTEETPPAVYMGWKTENNPQQPVHWLSCSRAFCGIMAFRVEALHFDLNAYFNTPSKMCNAHFPTFVFEIKIKTVCLLILIMSVVSFSRNPNKYFIKQVGYLIKRSSLRIRFIFLFYNANIVDILRHLPYMM